MQQTVYCISGIYSNQIFAICTVIHCVLIYLKYILGLKFIFYRYNNNSSNLSGLSVTFMFLALCDQALSKSSRKKISNN